MAAGPVEKTVTKNVQSKVVVNQSLSANNDVSDWVLCQGDIAIQLTGAATAVTAVVERSTRNPSNTPNAAPVAGSAISGNPSTGIQVASFYEPGAAWWRVRLTALTGTPVNVSIASNGE